MLKLSNDGASSLQFAKNSKTIRIIEYNQLYLLNKTAFNNETE